MKTILILSSEPWGKMLLSKMHYALELAELGNTVYFVNPPRNIKVRRLANLAMGNNIPNLTIIQTKIFPAALFFRYNLFFLYKKISSLYVNAIKKIVLKDIDEVWCFDPHVYVDLKKFNAKKTIVLLYDFYKDKNISITANNSNGFVTISKVILDFYSKLKTPKLLMQHGLGKHFSELATEKMKSQEFKILEEKRIKVGYVGNLLRAAMDVEIAIKIISEHPDKEFHFFGPYNQDNNNVAPVENEVPQDQLSFIEFLKKTANVVLHGVTQQESLSRQLFEMDIFLFLYAASKDINNASNSHKLVEYLSTGKAVVSTYVSTYSNKDLLIMSEPDQDYKLCEIFSNVTNDLNYFNSEEKQKKRVNYALSNTYKNQIKRIHTFMYGQVN